MTENGLARMMSSSTWPLRARALRGQREPGPGVTDGGELLYAAMQRVSSSRLYLAQ